MSVNKRCPISVSLGVFLDTAILFVECKIFPRFIQHLAKAAILGTENHGVRSSLVAGRQPSCYSVFL